MTVENSLWPLPKFNFSVTGIPGNPVFQEVSGLDAEPQSIEYRTSTRFASLKMPGLQKVGNVTLKRGVFATDTTLWTLFDSIKMSTTARSTVVISLLDEADAPIMTWTLTNAFPVKLSGADLNGDSQQVVVEALEIAYETMTASAA